MSEDMRIPNKFVGLSKCTMFWLRCNSLFVHAHAQICLVSYFFLGMYFAGQLLHLIVIGLSTITPGIL